MQTQTPQSETQKIPKLRFLGFKAKWEDKRLEEVANFLKGKDISKDDIFQDGKNKCIRYGELYTDYGEIIKKIKSRTNISECDSLLSKKNDVLVPSSGETALDIATFSFINEDNVLLGGDLNVLRFKESQNGAFYAYYLSNYKRRDIARIVQGYSVVHLYASQLKKLNINLPTLPEQQKIAEFLGSVDEWIENLRAQKESFESYKKGMMRKIFTQEVRFKDEKGKNFPKWEEKKLGEVFISEKGDGLPKDEVIGGGKNECILYGELYTTYKEVIFDVRSKTNSNNGLKSEIGDLLIPCSTTTTGIDLANVTALNKKGVLLGGDITILRSKTKTNNIFYAYYLSNYKKREIAKYAQGSTIVHLYYNHFKKMNIDVPCYEDQNKIAEFLVSVDKVMEAKQQQITQAEQWKKGLMQGLFV